MRRFFHKGIRWTGVISIITALVTTLLPAQPALAAFAMSMSVNNTSGTSYTNIPFIANTGNDLLINNGLMLPNGLDTRVYNSSGTPIPHMLADNYTLFVGDAPAHTASSFTFKGGETVLPSMDIIPGYSGNVTTPDDPSIEPGKNFDVSVSGYFDTSAGTDKYIIRKNGALVMYISNNQEITANITSPSSGNYSVVAAGIASGVHTIEVWADGTALRIEVDGEVKDTTAYVSGTISPTASPHGLTKSGMVYIDTHNADNASAYDTCLGQWNQSTAYAISRLFLSFDTSLIPDTSDIISANITGTLASKAITVNNFNFTIVDGSALGAGDNVSNYGTLLTSTIDFGHINTADMPVSPTSYTIYLNSLGLAQVNKTGNTQYGIRGSNDINSDPIPALNEYQRVAPTGNFILNVTYGVKVKDTSNDWYWMTNNTMAYADNISIIINGVQKLLYCPNNIIHGNTLPDVSANNNDGIITWGTSYLTVTAPALITLPATNVVATSPATNVVATSATLNGQLLDMVGMSSFSTYFQYGLDTSYGSTTTPVVLSAPGLMTAGVTGLFPNTTYHFRAAAVSGNITLYGGDLSFITLVGEGGGLLQMGGGNARVFSNYLTTGDLLFTAEIVNTYMPYYPNQSPKEFFTVQLIGTDNTTILAATPQRQWGDKPIAIYLNPAQAKGITYGAGYYIRIQANFSANVTAQYKLQHLPWANDWKGSDLTRLDDWCIFVATNMQKFHNGSGYVTVLTDRELAITDAVGGYFTTGIPAIGQVRPNLFTTSQQNPVFNMGVADNTWDNATAWSVNVGPSIAADAAVFAIPFGLTGRDLAAAGIALGMLGVVMTGAASTGGFGALGFFLISIPILWLGTYFKIVGVQYVMALTIIFGFLFVRQFWIKTT